MCEVASFKNFENSLTTAKVMTKTKVAPFYLGHGVVSSLWNAVHMLQWPLESLFCSMPCLVSCQAYTGIIWRMTFTLRFHQLSHVTSSTSCLQSNLRFYFLHRLYSEWLLV